MSAEIRRRSEPVNFHLYFTQTTMSLDALFDRKPPTLWQQFLHSPLLFVTRRAYSSCSTNLSPLEDTPASGRIRVVCISDTHNTHESLPTLPPGDILIHAGDLTNSGTEHELRSVLDWLSAQSHPLKVFIAGNHDTILATPTTKRDAILSCYSDLIYLENSSVTLNVREHQITVYGSPCTPRHGSGVFQYPRGKADWSHIPPPTDILITHGPPVHHLDSGGAGCPALLQALWRIRPRLHVFGHIHVGRGVECVAWSDAQMAYERVFAGKWGWKDIFYLTLAAVRTFFCGRPAFSEKESTTLVNAASIGGLRDEKRREATVIDLIP